MKLIRFLFITIGLSVVINACHKSTQKATVTNFPIEKIEIHPAFLTPKCAYDSIYIKQIIKLQEPEDLPIGKIDKLILTKERIFALDYTYSKYLYVFDRDGSFLFKIGDKGRGPREYFRSPQDFFINESQRQIEVFESNLRKIYVYDWDGDIIKEKQILNCWPESCAPLDSSFTAYSFSSKDRHRNNLFLLQIKDSKQQSIFNFKPLTMDVHSYWRNHFYKTDSVTYFVEGHCDTIYALKNNTIAKGIWVNFGDKAVPVNFQSDIKMDMLLWTNEVMKSPFAHSISNIVETDTLFCFDYIYKSVGYHVVYNKNKHKYMNGFDVFSGFPSSIYANHKNDLVTVIDNQYIELQKNAYTTEKEWNDFLQTMHPAIRKILYENRDKEASSYIIIYKLKF